MGELNKINCTTGKFNVQNVSSRNDLDNIIYVQESHCHKINNKKTLKILETISVTVESDIRRIKSNTFKLLAHMNNGIKKSSDINPCIHKQMFLYY